MARRHYTDDERAAGLAVLALHGGNLKRAAREAGVPERTLRRWTQEAPEEVGAIAAQKKADLADLMEDIARRAAGCITMAIEAIEADPALAIDKFSDLNRVAGTALDKMRVLRGETSERTEVVIRYVNDWRSPDA